MAMRDAVVAPPDPRVSAVERVFEECFGRRILSCRICIEGLREQHPCSIGGAPFFASLREQSLSLFAVVEG